jgi:hypothetical protein
VRDVDVEKRRSREIRFFLQALLNTFFFDFCIVNFTLLSRLTDTKWGWFWTTIIPWLMSHASNGYVMLCWNMGMNVLMCFSYLALVFQQDMRTRLVNAILCKKTVTSTTVTKITKF